MQERGAVAPLTEGHPALSPYRCRALSIAVALAVVGLDQITKTLALHYLEKGPAHVIGPLSLDLTFNSGAAFSLGTGFSPILAAVAVVLIVILWRTGRSAVAVLSCVGIGLVLGGAVGNLVDRLLRANGGAVIDFVDFKFWPTFNLADSCIVIGVGLLVWTGLRQKTR